MGQNGFREGKKIEDEEGSKDILLKQLNLAHKRELEFGKYIMLIKGWAVTLFSGLLLIYFAYLEPEDKNCIILLLFILPFLLLWLIEALIGAYQAPYYTAITEIENELIAKENNRKIIPLTYQNQKHAYVIVGENFFKCLLHISVFPFYVLPMIAFIILWIFSICGQTSEKYQILNVIEILTGIAIIIVNIVVAIFIFRQVKAAELENQKSVVPVLGITLKERNGDLIKPLYGYVRNNIALDVKCKISINGDFLCSRETYGAIPSLNNDIKLPIWEINEADEYIIASTKEKKAIFKAEFTYKSILRNEYRSIYVVKIWNNDDGKLQKVEELESWELPWRN